MVELSVTAHVTPLEDQFADSTDRIQLGKAIVRTLQPNASPAKGFRSRAHAATFPPFGRIGTALH
jgi:hypothetical protein